MPKVRNDALHENYREQIKQLAREQMIFTALGVERTSVINACTRSPG